MLLLALGLVLFFAIHLLPSSPGLRDGLIERFGKGPYLAVFSLAALLAFALVVYGFAHVTDPRLAGKNPQLWVPPVWMKHVAFLLMLPACIFLVAAYTPSRIRTALKHPLLVAIKTWALAHLLVNGDLAGVVLFSSFLLFAVYDRITLKRRPDRQGPLGKATGGLSGDIVAVAGGLAFYAFMLLWGHAHLIGKPLIATSFAP